MNEGVANPTQWEQELRRGVCHGIGFFRAQLVRGKDLNAEERRGLIQLLNLFEGLICEATVNDN